MERLRSARDSSTLLDRIEYGHRRAAQQQLAFERRAVEGLRAEDICRHGAGRATAQSYGA
jgi:hypothetical protein